LSNLIRVWFSIKFLYLIFEKFFFFFEDNFSNFVDTIGYEECRENINRVVIVTKENDKTKEYGSDDTNNSNRFIIPKDKGHEECI
jgi:hypothetical protein